MSLWNDLGFTENPYSPRPVPGNDLGVRLLVGREIEMTRLTRYLRSSDTHPSLEGSNGVGKTSLVLVVAYKAQKAWLDSEEQQALLLVGEPFQLTTQDTAPEFRRRVLFRVAQSFIEHHQELMNRGFNVPDIGEIETWLNSPILRDYSGNFSALGFGGGGQRTSSVNAGQGFTEAGFTETVRGWLRDCFPTNAAGGFVCVIDNLELLETSRNARTLLEEIRDEVLGIQGLRWVLCGARGIVRSAASSPRLQGVIADPLIVNPVNDDSVGLLLEARLQCFRMSSDAIAPVEPRGLEHLYQVGNRNLRNAMKYSEDFSLWSADHGIQASDEKAKFDLLEVWMAELADESQLDTKSLGNRAWEVFDLLVAKGGTTSPSEYEDFGFESNQAMRPHLRNLEEANLIESAIDETDNRRKTISVSSRGWIVNYARSGFDRIGRG